MATDHRVRFVRLFGALAIVGLAGRCALLSSEVRRHVEEADSLTATSVRALARADSVEALVEATAARADSAAAAQARADSTLAEVERRARAETRAARAAATAAAEEKGALISGLREILGDRADTAGVATLDSIVEADARERAATDARARALGQENAALRASLLARDGRIEQLVSLTLSLGSENYELRQANEAGARANAQLRLAVEAGQKRWSLVKRFAIVPPAVAFALGVVVGG